MAQPTTWVGLDVHKDSITAAILEGDSHDPEVVRMSSDLMKVRKLFRRLSERGPVRACYEASGAGFVLHRALDRDGFSCQVVAPSLIPRKPGERRKTDRIDAIQLVRLLRSGHLTPVHIPDEEQEAVRRLVRLRLTYQRQITATKLRISSILLSQGLVFRGTKSGWTKKHRSWLREIRTQLTGPLATVVGTELEHLEYLETQRGALDAEIDRFAQTPTYRLQVEALMCLRGVKTLTAMTLVTEIGDARRFHSPRSLMSWIGLVPQERSSGNRERKGPITKTGNRFLRRILTEAAQNNRTRCESTLILKRRRQGQPPEVVAVALKAQHRLAKKYQRLVHRKHHNVAVTAVARELTGFVWAIMNLVASRLG